MQRASASLSSNSTLRWRRQPASRLMSHLILLWVSQISVPIAEISCFAYPVESDLKTIPSFLSRMSKEALGEDEDFAQSRGFQAILSILRLTTLYSYSCRGRTELVPSAMRPKQYSSNRNSERKTQGWWVVSQKLSKTLLTPGPETIFRMLYVLTKGTGAMILPSDGSGKS